MQNDAKCCFFLCARFIFEPHRRKCRLCLRKVKLTEQHASLKSSFWICCCPWLRKTLQHVFLVASLLFSFHMECCYLTLPSISLHKLLPSSRSANMACHTLNFLLDIKAKWTLKQKPLFLAQRLRRKVSEVKLLTARAQWEKTVSGAFDVLLSSILLFMYMPKGTDNKYL